MKRDTLAVAVAAALAVLLLLWWQGRERDRAVAWEQQAREALAAAQESRQRADSLASVAWTHEARADSLEAAADARSVVTRQRIVEMREVPVPVEVVRWTAPRDSVIDELLTELDEREAAAAELRASLATLRAGYATLQASHDRLRETLEARPKPRSPLIPSILIGPQAGVGTSGTYTGVGVTLGWTLRL